MHQEKSKPMFSKRVKRALNSVLVVSLFSGLVASGLIYSLTKHDNQKNWCRQEIKKFDYNNYTRKELSMLIQECKDEIKTYSLLEDILYNSNDTQKFSSIVNQLYVDKKIDNEFIIEFSDDPLIKKINNPNYNFHNENLYNRNNLPAIIEQIEKYLIFTKEILFTNYTEEQHRNYFSLLIRLFRDSNLIKNNEAPKFSMFGIDDNTYELEIDKNLLHLQEIFKNLGKVDNRKISIDFDKPFYISFSILINSYTHKDNKQNLINEVIKLSEIIDKNMNRNRIGKIDNNQWMININRASTSAHILRLFLLELSHYKLDEKELKTIFNQYVKIIPYQFFRNTFHKLIHNLFTDEIMSGRKDFKGLYEELFLQNFKEKYIVNIIDRDFITYLALKKNINIIKTLLKTFESDKYFKLNIFYSLIVAEELGNKNFYMLIDYEDILIEMIKKEKDEDMKRDFIRNILVLNNVKLIEYAINHIYNNYDFYIRELDNKKYYGSYFYLSSIFGNLANSKVSIFTEREEIKNKKADLYIKLINDLTSKENKLNLISACTRFITKDDFHLIRRVKDVISKEKDITLREQMQKEFNKIYTIN